MNGETENQITSDDILGREAIDPEGEYLGIVMKLHIDRQKKELLGITVDQGFMKPDLYIGLEYIKRFGIDAIFINRIPSEKYRGLAVYNASGKLCGTVYDLVEEEHRITQITVKKSGRVPTPGQPLDLVEVPARKIEELGHAVVLKKGVLEDIAGAESDGVESS